ncbi:hypothetical protein [Roseibium alexandrii]|uniref:Uncharacterized protein n=1 Tax=Roseibium alexandrii (strain DSM 17067 / NCIMB 14079 / DFL-11) TaxID=244592 RepID=A0A5E8GX15_ROSAD|nr:hypothetical protein [Roseibium alexandrii]EEE44274.2 hypothetical protein SADFL11_1561 [Roseibium alexandrii DFL-11]
MNRPWMLLWIALFLSGCATVEDRANSAGDRLGKAAAEARPDPALPGDCRRKERSGVREGEPLDVALIKTDQALGRANARVRRCTAWHDNYRADLKTGN